MATHIERMTKEELVTALYSEEIDINEITLEKIVQRDAFLEVLKQRPALIGKIAEENTENFLKYALESDYEYFVYIITLVYYR